MKRPVHCGNCLAPVHGPLYSDEATLALITAGTMWKLHPTEVADQHGRPARCTRCQADLAKAGLVLGDDGPGRASQPRATASTGTSSGTAPSPPRLSHPRSAQAPGSPA